MKEQNKILSEKAKKADKLAQNFSKEVKMATEAMQRTIRHRKTKVILHNRSVYHQVF